MVTSAFVLGYHLSHTQPDLRLYVVGEESLINELRGHRLNVVNEFMDQDPKQVIDPSGVDAGGGLF